ncbi:MAG: hypothetical protein JWO38_7754 [Gemmataceae bacterium]|nr:hypothetical protein [Gemmataceae bacterium]
MFSTLLSRLFIRTPAHPQKVARRFRPRLEALDERIVPAGYYVFWTDNGGDFQASNAANWQGAGPTGLPSAGDNISFGNYGNKGTDECQGFSGSYRTVMLNSSYTGKVTLSGSLSVGTLGLNGGVISQPVGGTDITVTRISGMSPYEVPGFSWSGGTLNDTAHAANLTVIAGTALIDPQGGTLKTGSTLSFTGGTTGTFNPGAVEFANDAGINVDAASTVSSTGTGAAPVQLKLKLGANGAILSAGTFNAAGITSDLPITITGGTMTVYGGTASFAGNVKQANGTPLSSSILQTGGTIVIDNGWSLTSAKNIELDGGKLSTRATTNGIQLPAMVTAGTLFVDGADIVISDPTYSTGVTGHQFGTLKVTGDIEWTGGTYRPFVDGTANSVTTDLWTCTGTFTIDGTVKQGQTGAKYGPVDVNSPPGGPGIGRTWAILTASSIVIPAGGVGPVSAVPSSWGMIGGSGDKQWFLRRLN